MPEGDGGQDVSPAWLTAVLRSSGALHAGRVVGVRATANDAFNSTVVHLEVEYSVDAEAGLRGDAALPRRLLLKRNLSEPWAVRAGKREVEFYRWVQTMAPGLSVFVPCYHAAFDQVTGRAELLLLDVSASHRHPVTRDELIGLRGVPPERELEAVVDAVAGLAAAWWEHPSLGEEPGALSSWYPDQEGFERRHSERRTEWEQCLAANGDVIPPDLRSLYEDALDGLPRLWDRFLADRIGGRRRLTLSHGDCFLSQFLVPRDGSGSPAYLIDFQDAAADLPAVDLVFLFATFWTREQRREGGREERLLRRYVSTLQRLGVRDYSWDELLFDYRLFLPFMIFYPVWDAVSGAGRNYWWPKMQCLTAAYEDWDCAELLDERKQH